MFVPAPTFSPKHHFLNKVNGLSLKGVGGARGTGHFICLSGVSVQRIKARKIKHFLSAPENLPSSILENLFSFLSAEFIFDITSLSQTPNSSHEAKGSDEWAYMQSKIIKLQIWNCLVYITNEMLFICSGGAWNTVLKKHTSHHGIFHWRGEQCTPALSTCWHWRLPHPLNEPWNKSRAAWITGWVCKGCLYLPSLKNLRFLESAKPQRKCFL